MLKALASNCRSHHVTSSFQSGLRCAEPKSPLIRLLLSSLRNSGRTRANLYYQRAFYCSDASDGSDTPVEKRVEEGEEVESKSSSAIVPTVFRPEDYLTVSLVYISLFIRLIMFFFFCLILMYLENI